MKRLLFLALCLTPLFGEAALKTYSDPGKGFSVDYEDELWALSDKKAGGGPEKANVQGAEVDNAMGEKTLVTLQRIKADEKYHARFSVVVEPAAKFEDKKKDLLTAYSEHALKFLKSQRFDIQTTVKKPLPKLQTEGYEIVASQNDFGLTFRQIVFIRGKDAYMLTAAVRSSQFEKQDKEAKAILDSVRFKP